VFFCNIKDLRGGASAEAVIIIIVAVSDPGLCVQSICVLQDICPFVLFDYAFFHQVGYHI